MNLLKAIESKSTEPARSVTGYSFAEAERDQPLQMRVVDPLRERTWDHLVTLHHDADYFHTTAWARVLHQTYKHQPFYLQFSRGHRLAALIPLMEVRSLFTGRRGVCLPFSDRCEPLIFDPGVIGLVRDRLVRFAHERRWRYLEIRGGKSFPRAASLASKFYGHTLNLCSGAEALMTSFASPVRRAIRKAERNDVSALVARNRQAVSEFYRLHAQTRRRHGLPPQPASFFINIYEHIVRPGLGFVVLAQQRSRSIAGAIFFRFGKNALYKFGASDEKFQEFRPNNLVIWHGIQFLVRTGAERLHFGRTEFENDGLRRFKLSWGTKEEIIDYLRVDPLDRQCLASAGPHSGFHTKIFGRLPLALNRLAGSMIYPHLD